MLIYNSIRQSPIGPSGVVTPAARSHSRVDRTSGALPFLDGRFAQWQNESTFLW
jgi:hypothetical protein